MTVSKLTGKTPDLVTDTTNESIVDVTRVPGDPTKILPAQAYVSATSKGKTALSLGIDSSIRDRLRQFVSGKSLIVTWLSQMENTDSTASFSTGLSFLSNSVNRSYSQIKNMEIVLENAIAFEFDAESRVSSATGTAVVYAGTIPKPGDLFVSYIDDGTPGLFMVGSNPERMTYRNDSNYRIEFKLNSVLTNTQLAELTARIRETSYFVKTNNYLGRPTVLTEQALLDMQYLDKNIDMLFSHFINKYYNKDASSVLNFEGQYDPYVVEFIHKFHGPKVGNVYIKQLIDMVSSDNWDRSIYAKLLSRDNIIDTLNTCTTYRNILGYRNNNINYLLNKTVVRMCEAVEPPVEPEDGSFADIYNTIETTDYMAGNPLSPMLDTTDKFSVIVTMFIEYGVVAYATLKELVDTIRFSNTPTVCFYQIPVLIYMLKTLALSLSQGANINLIEPDISPYTNVSFVNDDLVDSSFTVIATPGVKVVGLIDNTGSVVYLDSDNIDYVDTGIVVDLTSVFIDLDIT